MQLFGKSTSELIRGFKKNQNKPKIHISPDGGTYIRIREMAESKSWREQIDALYDADLTGVRQSQEVNQ